jgi:hypothetical protein
MSTKLITVTGMLILCLAEPAKTDDIESSSSIVKKTWMGTRRKSGRNETIAAVNRIMHEISQFSPQLVLLGDDNAANCNRNQLIDTDICVVFWGVDNHAHSAWHQESPPERAERIVKPPLGAMNEGRPTILWPTRYTLDRSKLFGSHGQRPWFWQRK